MTPVDNSTTVTLNNTIDSANWFLQTSLWSLRLVCPLFFIVGPFFNWACIRIFQSRIYARSSTRWYFIFIAIFDTIYVLVTAPLLFLITFQIYILNWDVLLCKSIVFLNYLSCQISAGLLACLSVDRLVATSCLSLYRQNCTTNLSKSICLAVIFIFSIVNSHYLIGYTLDSNGYCNIRRYKWYEKNYSNLNVVYLLSYSIIPFTIITICNIFIVLTVCQNKTKMKTKYKKKKPNSSLVIPHEQFLSAKDSLQILKCSTDNPSINENKYEMFVSFKNQNVMSTAIEPNAEWQQTQRMNRLSDKLLLNGDISANSTESSGILLLENKPLHLPYQRERSFSTSFASSSSPTNSQKMCIQLQITISLLAISICFIFCTLPNCISTIMIQTYSKDERVRKFWQTMNYFSIVPLLMTHSVNLVFYYLSSNMFRERFKEYYFKKKT